MRVLRSQSRNHAWSLFALSSSSAICLALFGTSCSKDASVQSSTYFDRTIQPILTHSCSRQTTGCHVADSKGNAVGTLDTTSFELLDRRHDLLVTYGPYSAPGLLTKVGGPQTLTVSTLAGSIEITTDIRHAAGSGIDVTSEGYATLRRWMDGGATKDNVGATSGTHLLPTGDCMKTIPNDPAFAGYDPGATYDQFVNKVQPVLKKCSAGSCHGNIVADLSLTCGSDPDQLKWNHYIASQFLSGSPESSELLRRPLDPARGGVFHEGGIVFNDSDEDDYKALLAWAKDRGPAAVDTTSPDAAGFAYFANRVQPMMVRKGCMFLGCHSPQMFHDLRLRGGSGGQFSLVATRRNYLMSKLMLSVESPDPNVSRLIAKNLFPFDRDIDAKGLGIRHRGGALLEDTVGSERATPADCDKIKDIDTADLSTVPAYCVFVAWHAKERAAAIAKGPTAGGIDKEPLTGIAYVERPPNTDVPQAFDTYRPGAALHVAAATLSTTGTVTMGADKDVTSGCGLSSATADIRGPAVSRDATTIAFAARSAADQPLAIYTMKADGSGCAKHAKISEHAPSDKGILIHDFDPAFSPRGELVFASTRGALDESRTEYKGPTRTPGSFLPNSNIYILESDGTIRQGTFLLGAELSPELMKDGRLIMTTEKRAPGFYQLAGRRMNLDGGDYHPLYAQRKSIGFEQMTEIHELADRGFVGIMSDKGALAGGGTLGVVNRSLGPDQFDRDPADHFYLHSLTFPDPAATGKAGPGGVYRSPAPLPTHGFLVSYAAGADAFSFDGTFELVQIDTHNGTRVPLVKTAGKSIVESVAIYARADYGVFESKLDEVNGATIVEKGAPDADVRVLDMGLLASLLFTNTRIGRTVDPDLLGVGFLESLPPTEGLTSIDAAPPDSVFTDEYGKFWLKRRRLGVVPVNSDGSLAGRLPGGVPLVLELYHDTNKAPVATQKEEMEFRPGERSRVAFRGDFFDAQCGGCHGSISGREIDVHLRPDVLTSASRVEAFSATKSVMDLFGAKGPVVPNDPSLAK
jgi:hypothetical protein